MEAIALPRAAEVAAGLLAGLVKFRNAGLSADGLEVEEWVFVVESADHFGFVDWFRGID